MAFASDSTTAPARPLLPLRGPGGRFARRAEARPELPPEPLLAAEVVLSEDTPEAIRADLDALVADCIGNSRLVAELPTALEARTIHLRRQLAAAVDHGADLLAALGLPRLIGQDHIVVDPEAAGAALDSAIAALDALDGDPDIEPWLAGFDCTGGGDREAEPEHDEDDGTREPSLATPERHPSPPVWGFDRVYTDRGPDSSQLRWAEGAHHDGEAVNEDGDDLDAGEHDTADAEASLGWPEDVGAVLGGEIWILTAEVDAEADDADLEDSDPPEHDFRSHGPALLLRPMVAHA